MGLGRNKNGKNINCSSSCNNARCRLRRRLGCKSFPYAAKPRQPPTQSGKTYRKQESSKSAQTQHGHLTNMRDNVTNEIVGFEVDLANACAAKLDLTIQWNDVGFDNIILSVQQGQLDMGVSGFSITARKTRPSFLHCTPQHNRRTSSNASKRHGSQKHNHRKLACRLQNLRHHRWSTIWKH